MQRTLHLATLCAASAAAALPPIAAGAPLTLQPCEDGAAAQSLALRGDGTIRSSDGAFCVTGGGDFPAPLTMQACAPGSAAQAFTREGSAYETTDSSGACVAWNTATSTLIISLYTCQSLAWNGAFTPSSGRIYPNYTAPDSPPTPPGTVCVTAAPFPPPPVCPAPQCSSDIDCNLNGACGAGGACACYKPWGGATCGELRFLPIAAPASTNGFPGASPNETTWGGNAVYFQGQFHLFVAEMVNGCSLAQWGQNSQCAHAVSSSPEGPYVKVDTAVPVWCQ